MHTLTIAQKMSNTGSIHDLASDQFDRDIVFGTGCQYAVVLASYYGGKGYTTHKTESATIRAAAQNKEYSHQILDRDGREYIVHGDRLVRR